MDGDDDDCAQAEVHRFNHHPQASGGDRGESRQGNTAQRAPGRDSLRSSSMSPGCIGSSRSGRGTTMRASKGGGRRDLRVKSISPTTAARGTYGDCYWIRTASIMTTAKTT